jgi:hypothetical protein
MSGTSAAASRAARLARRAAALLLLGASGAAVAGAGGYGWPVWWGAGAAYPWYFNVGGCLPGGACAAWAWQDRRPFRRPTAPEPLTFDDQDIWGTTGSPWGYVQRMPPPTPESQIQPRYRDASTIRPEFDRP